MSPAYSSFHRRAGGRGRGRACALVAAGAGRAVGVNRASPDERTTTRPSFGDCESDERRGEAPHATLGALTRSCSCRLDSLASWRGRLAGNLDVQRSCLGVHDLACDIYEDVKGIDVLRKHCANIEPVALLRL